MLLKRYRQSINCQAEARYAFKRNKPIIPLIMQSGYEDPNGWLGLIMSDKIFVNFIKYEFDECMRRLNHEIDSILGNTKKTSNQSSSSFPPPIDSKNSGDASKLKEENKKNLDWSEAEVKEWFDENNLNILLFDYFKPMTGKILKELYEMKRNSSDLYFQSLKEIENIKFNMIMAFTACLEELFNAK